jgi:hypothetical protein
MSSPAFSDSYAVWPKGKMKTKSYEQSNTNKLTKNISMIQMISCASTTFSNDRGRRSTLFFFYSETYLPLTIYSSEYSTACIEKIQCFTSGNLDNGYSSFFEDIHASIDEVSLVLIEVAQKITTFLCLV